MRQLFKKTVDFVSHIKAFFKPYEEELLIGFDVEKLLSDPNRQIKVEHMQEINQKKSYVLAEKYNNFMNEYVVVERISSLSGDLATRVQALCKQYSEMTVVKEEIEKRSIEAKKKEHPTIGLYIRDIPNAISILKEHEAHQQSVRNDLNILEGEKEDLLYQFRNLKRALVFLRSFLIFLAFATLLSGVILSTMLIVNDQAIFMPALIVVLLISFLFLWAYIFRRYCVHELKKNQMMQERAIKLINKTKIKFVHNQQLLEFQYKKYKVNSSEVLELRYDNYMEAKDEAKNFENINNSMRAIVIDLDRQLTRIHIENTEFVLRHIDYFATNKGLTSLKSQYEELRSTMQLELKKLEHEKEVLSSIS